MTTSSHLNHNNNTTGKQSQNWYLNHSNLHCMISVNFYYGNKSHFYTPDCSQTIFQANQYRPTTDHRNLVSSYHLISPSLLPPQHKMNEKKKIVNILLNQSMNQYCSQANNVLEWKLMTFLRAPLINIHCIS